MNGMFHWWDRRRTIDIRPCSEVKRQKSMCPRNNRTPYSSIPAPYVKVFTHLDMRGVYALYRGGVHTEYLQFWNPRGLHRMHARIRIQRHMQPVRNRGFMIESKKVRLSLRVKGPRRNTQWYRSIALRPLWAESLGCVDSEYGPERRSTCPRCFPK